MTSSITITSKHPSVDDLQALYISPCLEGSSQSKNRGLKILQAIYTYLFNFLLRFVHPSYIIEGHFHVFGLYFIVCRKDQWANRPVTDFNAKS